MVLPGFAGAGTALSRGQGACWGCCGRRRSPGLGLLGCCAGNSSHPASPPESAEECLKRPRRCWGGFHEHLLPTVAVSAMKRKAPDTRENGESKVTPHIPVVRSQAKWVSGWSVCGCRHRGGWRPPTAWCGGHAQQRGLGRGEAVWGGQVLQGQAGSKGA